MEGFKTRTENAEILIEKAAEAREGPLFTSLLSVVNTSVMQQGGSPLNSPIKGRITQFPKGTKGIKGTKGKVGRALTNLKHMTFGSGTNENPEQPKGLGQYLDEQPKGLGQYLDEDESTGGLIIAAPTYNVFSDYVARKEGYVEQKEGNRRGIAISECNEFNRGGRITSTRMIHLLE